MRRLWVAEGGETASRSPTGSIECRCCVVAVDVCVQESKVNLESWKVSVRGNVTTRGCGKLPLDLIATSRHLGNIQSSGLYDIAPQTIRVPAMLDTR